MSEHPKSAILKALKLLTSEEQIHWMVLLGSRLTTSARIFCETGTDNAEGKPLRGFNEIQHQVYGRILSLQREDAWTSEDFLSTLFGLSAHFGIAGEVQWALDRSLSFIEQPKTE